ncbi:MAG: hypothetical protein FJ390_02105 [Verrucomicrobia bacterium]|nr:hypothetical protein [Verrucomicrobiota bacterium]
MSARVAPSTSIDSSGLSIYQEFANRTDANQEEVIFSVDKKGASAPSITSASTQTTFQKIYRWLFGQKKSEIVEDFSAALKAKYGEKVASFAFSQDQKNQALHAGLSRACIKQIIEKANFARRAQDDIKAYARMAKINIQIAQRFYPERKTEIAELRQKFEIVRDFANGQLNSFKDITALQSALREAIELATNSEKILEEIEPRQSISKETDRNSISRTTIAIDTDFDERNLSPRTSSLTHSNEIDSTSRGVPDPPITGEALRIIHSHEEEIEPRQSSSKETDRNSISPPTDFDQWNLPPRTSSLAHSNEIDSISRDVPDAPITGEAFQATLEATRRQHQEVMSELKSRFQNNPKALEAQLATLGGAVVQAIEQTAPQLMIFSHHVQDDPSTHFRLDANGVIVVGPADFANARLTAEEVAEENQKVWRLFCNTLETRYGKPLLERMIPNERREALFSTPLTTGHVKQIFEEIQHSLEIDLEFLRKQPFIVDDAYCEALSAHPELLEKALQAEREAAAGGTLSIQIGRKLFDIGVLTAGYHAGGLVGTGLATTVTAMTGAVVPIIPVTFVASILCSWMAGRIVGSKTSQEVGSFAANRAAVYTIGGAGAEIASKPLIDFMRDYLTHCLAHLTVGTEGADAIAFLTQFALEEGGSIVADNIRHACIGSVVNGIDVAALPAHPDGLHPTQAADMDLRVINVLQDITNAVSQLSPPASHEYDLKRPRPHL